MSPVALHATAREIPSPCIRCPIAILMRTARPAGWISDGASAATAPPPIYSMAGFSAIRICLTGPQPIVHHPLVIRMPERIRPAGRATMTLPETTCHPTGRPLRMSSLPAVPCATRLSATGPSRCRRHPAASPQVLPMQIMWLQPAMPMGRRSPIICHSSIPTIMERRQKPI